MNTLVSARQYELFQGRGVCAFHNKHISDPSSSSTPSARAEYLTVKINDRDIIYWDAVGRVAHAMTCQRAWHDGYGKNTITMR